MELEKENYTRTELASLLSVHRDTIRRWEKMGYTKPQRKGTLGNPSYGRLTYTKEQVQEIINKFKTNEN